MPKLKEHLNQRKNKFSPSDAIEATPDYLISFLNAFGNSSLFSRDTKQDIY